jgi:hypothetical protein
MASAVSRWQCSASAVGEHGAGVLAQPGQQV